MMLSIEFLTRNRLFVKSKEVERCFKCATCALFCPVTLYGETYTPRKTFIYDIFKSDEPGTNDNLWSCAFCHKCYEVCPQDVNPPKVFQALKEVAFEQGQAPLSVAVLVEAVIQTGTAFPITEVSKRERARLNLPCFAPRDVEDLKKIAKNTGLERKLVNLRVEKDMKHEK